MSLGFSANNTTVRVIYVRPDELHRAVVQITIHLGKNPSEEQQVAYQNLLYSIKRLQALNRPPKTRSSRQ